MYQGFEGMYFKQQNENGVLCIIPAVHAGSDGRKRSSLQIITPDSADFFVVKDDMAFVNLKENAAQIGDSFFSTKGILLDVNSEKIKAFGRLRFSKISRVKGDVMGPFAHLPFLKCRHAVLSMKHTVNGILTVNGTEYRYEDHLGYIEGDKGSSFPDKYIWTQCMSEDVSVMMTAADMNIAKKRFRGVLGIVHYGGIEYRFATYLGAKLIKTSQRQIIIFQDGFMLSAEFEDCVYHDLKAPVSGYMGRTVREAPQCTARYTLRKGNRIILDFKSDRASLECEL